MMKLMLVLLILFIFLLFFFLNLGNFLDTTREPIKSDVIVCLGGGEDERIEKAIELYKSSYSYENVLILTGYDRYGKSIKSDDNDSRVSYLNKNNIKNINIIHKKDLHSTKEDIIYVKNYMISNNYKSAIIVSDPYHSRRVQFLIDVINIQYESDLSFNIVGTDLKWLDNQTYYLTKIGQVTVIHEFIKLVGSYMAYGILEKLGILEIVKEHANPVYLRAKSLIKKVRRYYLK